MKIIKPGNTTPKTYRKKCRRCRCEFEYTLAETTVSRGMQDEAHRTIKCPQEGCGNIINLPSDP